MNHVATGDRSAFDLPLSIPLVVDLDGTLIAGDFLLMSFGAAFRRNPLIVCACLLWLRRGRAALKHELARRGRVDWNRVRLHQDVLELVLREKSAGRAVVLATAADALHADAIAARLGVIDRVIASDGRRNLKGPEKAQALAQEFPDGFVYAGDSKSDLVVWQRARAIVLVNASEAVARAARAIGRPTLTLTARIAS
jgi:phosphoserine phosphatase